MGASSRLGRPTLEVTASARVDYMRHYMQAQWGCRLFDNHWRVKTGYSSPPAPNIIRPSRQPLPSWRAVAWVLLIVADCLTDLRHHSSGYVTKLIWTIFKCLLSPPPPPATRLLFPPRASIGQLADFETEPGPEAGSPSLERAQTRLGRDGLHSSKSSVPLVGRSRPVDGPATQTTDLSRRPADQSGP